jgi:hypothetical protein
MQQGRLEIIRQTMFVQRNNEALLFNHCLRGKETVIAYSGCVSVALVILRAKRRMRGIIFSSLACLFLPLFSHIVS